MTTTVQSPAHLPIASPSDGDVYAVFVVDALGHVVATNASAHRLWATGGRSLVTLPFTMLLPSDRFAADPELLLMEWKELKAEALERWAQRIALPFDGQARVVRVRIEPATGGAGSYIVTVQAPSNLPAA